MKHFYILLTLTLLLSGTNAVAKNYNAHDLAKVKTFLEQPSNGVRNIDRIWSDAPIALASDGSNWVGNLVGYFDWDSNGRLTKVDVSRYTDRPTYRGNAETAGPADFSDCAELREIWLFRNQITLLNVENCTKLTEVWTCTNRIEEVNIKGCYAIINFRSSSNRYRSLDLSNRTRLDYLHITGSTYLETLNLTGCTALRIANVTRSKISTINFSTSPNLEQSQIQGNTNLKSLDLSNSPKMRTLQVEDSNYRSTFTSLNISGCKVLTDYGIITAIPELEILNISNCALVDVDLSKNINLKELDCSGNNLHALDLSKNTKLTKLNASNQTVIIADAAGKEIKLNNGETLTLPVIALDGIKITPSENGEIVGSSVVWRNISTSNSYYYDFALDLPGGITGTPLGGKATVGAITVGNTIGEPSATPPSGGGCEPDSGSSTANEVVEVHTVYASNGQLYVQLSAPAVVRVHSIIGQVVAQTAKVTETTVALPKGIYFVSIGNSEAKKVVVR